MTILNEAIKLADENKLNMMVYLDQDGYENTCCHGNAFLGTASYCVIPDDWIEWMKDPYFKKIMSNTYYHNEYM